MFNRQGSDINIRNIVAGCIYLAAQSDEKFPMSRPRIQRIRRRCGSDSLYETERHWQWRRRLENAPIRDNPQETRKHRPEDGDLLGTIQRGFQPGPGVGMRGQILTLRVNQDVYIRQKRHRSYGNCGSLPDWSSNSRTARASSMFTPG